MHFKRGRFPILHHVSAMIKITALAITLARGFRLPMASALKSFLFFLHSTAVIMMIMSVTTAMGANTAAIIQRLLGGFLTTAERRRAPFAVITSLHSKLWTQNDSRWFIDRFTGSIAAC